MPTRGRGAGPSRPEFRRAPRGVDPLAVGLLLWTLFIAYGTMLPFDFRADPEMAWGKLRGVAGVLGRPSSKSDVVSNVLLFLPWGLLYASRAASRGDDFRRVMAVAPLGGLALSALVEAAQLFLPSRTTSPVDLATNSLGSTIGALAGWALARRAWPTWGPRLRAIATRRPMAAGALAAATGLAVAGLAPFDVSLDLGDLKASIKSARPIPFGPPIRGEAPPPRPWSWAQEAATWSLAGGLAALAALEAGRRGSGVVARALASCVGLASAIEVAQLAIPGRASDATTVVFEAIGAAAGAVAVASRPRINPRRWIGPALALWALAVALAAWTPPTLATAPREFRASQLIPFWSYYERTDINALADLLVQVIAFTPLGALLAAQGLRDPIRRSLLIGLAIGAALECGQWPLADRTADLTDALSAAAGSALGAWIWVAASTAEARQTFRRG